MNDTSSRNEQGAESLAGIRLFLSENPLPPLPEAITAATAELPRSNRYPETCGAPLRRLLAERLQVSEDLLYLGAGSETILHQLFGRFGERVHLVTPTDPVFAKMSRHVTETRLRPEQDFHFDLAELWIPPGTTLVVLANPNDPTGLRADLSELPKLLVRYPETTFLVHEAFLGLDGESVVREVPRHHNLIVTRTFSTTYSLAGFRVGYAVAPPAVVRELNATNDAHPLSRASEAAAIATLRHEDAILERSRRLRTWTDELAAGLQRLGVRTFPTDTYFFLADFAPHDAAVLAEQLREQRILIKPLGDPHLGPDYVRVTTALPDENARFLHALQCLLRPSSAEAASRDPTVVDTRKDAGPRVLLAVDPSPCSRAAVREVARRDWPQGTQVEVFSVAHTRLPRVAEPTMFGIAIHEQAQDFAHERCEGLVNEVAEELSRAKPDLVVSRRVADGPPKARLLEETERWHPDLLLVGSHERGRLGRFFHGSVSRATLRHAPCPVEVVQEEPLF